MNDPSIPKLAEVEEPKKEKRFKGSRIVQKSDLLSYLATLRRYKWSILGCAIIGMLVGYLKAAGEVPIYRANLTLLIEPQRPKVGAIEQIMTTSSSSYRFFQTQTDIIKSRAIADRISTKLDPDKYLWLREPRSPGQLGVVINEFYRFIGQTPEQPTERNERLEGPDLTRRMANQIKNGIQVKGGQASHIVRLTYESPDPQFAADVVNSAADAYIELSLDARLSAIKVANDWLNKQIEELRQKVSESEARLYSFQSQESLVDTQNLTELTSSRLSALNTEVTSAQVKVSALEKRYGEKHPAMVAARAELREVLDRLNDEKGQVVQTQSKGFQLAKLERDVSTYRQLYDQFLTRFKETDLAMRYDVNDVRVIDRAEVPKGPVSPDKRKIITTWLIFGLVVGILLTWLREFIDNTFKSPQDVESYTALPVLGVVPFVNAKVKKRSHAGKDSSPERFYIKNLKSGFAESVNHIRTSVLYTDVDNPPKVVMITSAVQSEGKTTLSSNLALAFSQLNRTLLLDADLRKPRLADIAGLRRHGGLADVVAGHMKVSDCIVKDDEAENLFIMKSGTQPPNPLELISSEKFARLLSELRSRFDYIILDSPPVLPVSDAIVLGTLADAAILAIRAEKTHRSASVSALNNMQGADINVVGVALTQVIQRRAAYYSDGYYGYYGQYGDYYGTGEPATGKA